MEDEFRDDTSEIINMRDMELPDYPEEDYSVPEYLLKEDLENFVMKNEIEDKVEEALSAAIFEED